MKNSIYDILDIKLESDKEEVKRLYYREMFKLHPNNKKTGDKKKYMELQDAYKEYLVGDENQNCFRIVFDNAENLRCRCGDIYVIEPNVFGKIECLSCSCFVFVEKQAKRLEKNNV